MGELSTKIVSFTLGVRAVVDPEIAAAIERPTLDPDNEEMLRLDGVLKVAQGVKYRVESVLDKLLPSRGRLNNLGRSRFYNFLDQGTQGLVAKTDKLDRRN